MTTKEQIAQRVSGLDEHIGPSHGDFSDSGLKGARVTRAARRAIVHKSQLAGSIGSISGKRLTRIRKNIARRVKGNG